jgi:hypothetical protein
MPPKEQLKKGYEGFNVPENFSFPSCGIEDVDRALFDLFDKNLAFEVHVNEQTIKVPVVFAAGERFALTRRQKPIRDKNNALILPLIAIKRSSVGFKTESDAGGVPISFRQNTDYVVKKRLSQSDRDYQNIVNKFSLKNQDNVASRKNFLDNSASPGYGAIPGTIASRRNGPGIAFGTGRLNFALDNSISNNIFEVITIPYPIFVQLNYEITFWTQYMSQMNQILETMLIKTSGQGREFQIVSNKGFTFTAFLMGTLTSGDNFENFTATERIIRYTFSVRVPAYILAPRHPGLGNPARVFQTAPDVVFDTYEIRQQVTEPVHVETAETRVNKFSLSDVEALDDTGRPITDRNKETMETVISDPSPKYQSLVKRSPRSGEKISAGRIIKDIETTKN